MYCRICGTEHGIEFRQRSGMTLCSSCHRETPAKVSRETFDRVYWAGDAEMPPASTRREFWDDYRTSQYSSVASYIEATS